MLKDALDVIAEDTPEKQQRLAAMRGSAGRGGDYAAQARWIGKVTEI